MLARNSDVEGAVRSVRELEDRFNRKFRYPWVFLNEEDFDDDFKRCVVSASYCSCISASCWQAWNRRQASRAVPRSCVDLDLDELTANLSYNTD